VKTKENHLMTADFDRGPQPARHFSPLTEHAREQRDIGRPGGGAGRRDVVGGSGVYPASLGPDRIPNDAEIRTPAAWGQGERGPAGYYDSGRSELFMYYGQLLGGMDAGAFPPDGTLDQTGHPMRPPAHTGPAPERWNAGYSRPMVYDRENYDYAQSQTFAPDRSYGPVRWDTMGGRDRTHMNPDRIDMQGALPGRDLSHVGRFAGRSGPSFAGRGPRGYRRSDERIREDVCEALTMHPEVDASDLDVAVQDSVVTLRGTVHDRRSKRLAEDIAESVSGVTDVQNEVRTQGR
jgi:hypothetical protein